MQILQRINLGFERNWTLARVPSYSKLTYIRFRIQRRGEHFAKEFSSQ